MTKAKHDNVYRITYKIHGDATVLVTAPTAKEALRIFKEEPGSDPRIEGLGHDIRSESAFCVRLDPAETADLRKTQEGKRAE